MEKKGQNATELILILSALLIIAFLVYSVFIFFVETPDVKISESEAYWSGISYGLRLDEWKLSAASDSSVPAVEANLTFIAKNPLSEKITIRKIQIEQGDFGQVWYSDGSYAGQSDSLAIVLNPGDTVELKVQHYQNGADAYIPQEVYELDLSIVYDTPGIPSNVLNGSIPVIGKRGEFDEGASLDSICPTGTAECPASSGDCCAPSNCIGGVCKTNLCSGVVCDVPGCEICDVTTGSCYCTDATTPPEYYCSGGVSCISRETRNCLDGLAGYDSDTMICTDNCPPGDYCDTDCTCDSTCPTWLVCGESSELCCARDQKCGSLNTCENCPAGTIGCGTHCCPENIDDTSCDVTSSPATCSFCCPDGTFNCGAEYCCSNDQLCIDGICDETVACTSTQTACALDVAGSTYECCADGILCSMDPLSLGCVDPPTTPECEWMPVCGEKYCCGENQYCYDGLCVDALPDSPTCEYGTVCAPEDVCYALGPLGEKLSSGVCCDVSETCSNETGTCCPATQETCTYYNSSLEAWYGVCCLAGYSCAVDNSTGANVCCSTTSLTYNQRTNSGTDTFYLNTQCSNGEYGMCCDSSDPVSNYCIPPDGGETASCCLNTQICLTGTPSPDTNLMEWVCCSDSTFCGSDPSGEPTDDAASKLTAYGEQNYACCDDAQNCTVPSINGTPDYTCCPASTTCFSDVLCCSDDKLCTGVDIDDLYCCGDGQGCMPIPNTGSNPDPHICCEPSKYSPDTLHCCTNQSICTTVEPDLHCTDSSSTQNPDGTILCNGAPTCQTACCDSQSCTGPGDGGGTGAGVCVAVGDDCKYDEDGDGAGFIFDSTKCYWQCDIGDTCPVTCANGQCCESGDSCLSRPAPYNDEICCDEACREANNYFKTADNYCCPEARATYSIGDPPPNDVTVLYDTCCDYGSVAFKDASTNSDSNLMTWDCCSGQVEYVEEGSAALGALCCSTGESKCESGNNGATYECCDSGYCADAAQMSTLPETTCCTTGQACDVDLNLDLISDGCCPADASTCYENSLGQDACCAPSNLCLTEDGISCCDSGESCSVTYEPAPGTTNLLGNTCCPSANQCGSNCCINGAICNEEFNTCSSCFEDSDCTGSIYGDYCVDYGCVECRGLNSCESPEVCVDNVCVLP